MTTQTYQAASRQLLAQARTEPAAGDLRQASEKGWGANHLHSNFYENVDSASDVAEALDVVERFVGLLEPMAYQTAADSGSRVRST